MRRALFTFVSVVSLVSSVGVATARAQMYESVGVRAQGMGGAFVAVADDASATWWNPAGVATGAYFNTLLEYGRPDTLPDTDVRAFAMAFPALGLSYYRLPLSRLQPPATTAAAGTGRQDQGYLSQFGATFGQSVGNHFVLATTLKLLRAGETEADLDVGALANMGHVRVGLTVRNLRETTFGEGASQWSLKRAARAGAAFTAKGGGALDAITASVDADLTRLATPAGEERRVAGGVEAWLFKRAVGLRGGLSTDTINKRDSRSAGVSLMLQSGRYLRTYVDGQLTGGSDEPRRGWSADLRLTF